MSLPPPDFLPEDLLPSLPYYDLPAGLMVPLVKVCVRIFIWLGYLPAKYDASLEETFTYNTLVK